MAPRPAQAQTSWWDQYASPAAHAADDAACAKAEAKRLAAADPISTAAILLPASGAVRIFGPHDRLIPANIVAVLGDSYLVETRQGRQIVSVCGIYNPLFDDRARRRR